MKSLLRLLSLLFFLSIIIFSCQKEYSPEDIDPPVIVNDSNYLDKITIYDSSFGVYEIIRSLTYQYDASRRVIGIVDSMEDNGLKPHQQWDYFYNGTDSIPYKSKYYRYADAGSVSDTEIVYHYYDASQRRIKDSVIQITFFGTNETLINYTYTGNKIYTYHQNFSGVPYTDTSIVDSRGNIIYGATDEDSFVYEFDTKPSPLARLSNFKALSLYLRGEEFYDYFLLRNTNNFTKCVETYLTQKSTVINTYSYRADGYPVRKRNEEPDNPGNYEVEIFTYRSF